MKKKYIVIPLLSVGILLLGIPFLLAMKEAASMNIIGGAGWSTVFFVFFNMHHSLYLNLSCPGLLSIIASIVVALKRNTQNAHK